MMAARTWAVVVFAILGLPGAWAHQELYHNMEVDLLRAAETGAVGITFRIHAPELLVGSEDAAKAMYNGRWLEERSQEELEQLVNLARVYLAERFELRIDGGKPVDLAREVAFGEVEEIRKGEERGLPPACIEAALELAVPPGAQQLHIAHAAKSEKRLMVVLQRPKTFPGVIDLEPGSRAVVELPASEAASSDVASASEAPVSAPGGQGAGIAAAIVIGLIVLLFAARRPRRGRE